MFFSGERNSEDKTMGYFVILGLCGAAWLAFDGL